MVAFLTHLIADFKVKMVAFLTHLIADFKAESFANNHVPAGTKLLVQLLLDRLGALK